MADQARNEEDIYYAAIDRDPAERSAFVKASCGDDLELLERVEALLRIRETDGNFLDLPPFIEPMSMETAVAEGPGTLVDRYKLVEKIGEGGMAVVYMAEQQEPIRRKVALKIIKLGMDTKDVMARFEAERQVLAMMDHPNIAEVFDAGATETGRPYFVMELVTGLSIVEYCNQNRLRTKDRLGLFIQVCNAIQHAHQKGIIHRDIKPSNILVTVHDGVPVPRVIDFGIAKATQQELTEKTIYTQHNQFIGTPTYMSPEQAEMSGLDIDTRSDIYSLGVLLYELLTGRTPFEEKELLQSGIDQMRKIIREQEPQKPSTRFTALSTEDQAAMAASHSIDSTKLISLLRGDLDWIVMKCLEKDRTRRYATANDLASDISRHLSNEPVSACPPTAIYRIQKAWHRNRAFYTGGCLVMASLVIGISLSGWQAWEATNAHKREQTLREEAEARERRQHLNTYAADMKLGWQYLKKHKRQMVVELLDRYKPKPGEDDLRDIEWTYLDTATAGVQTYTLPHELEVRSLSLSQDGTRLASITISGKIRLFDVESQELLQQHGGGNTPYGARDGSVALSPDGRFLAADQQGTLMVWDADSEVVLWKHSHVVAPIRFSPDSHTLVGVTPAGLCLWDTHDWTNTRLLGTSLPDGTSQVHLLTFTPDGSRLIFAPTRFAPRLIVYNLTDDSVEGELAGLGSPHVISANDTMVAAGGRNGEVCVWDLASRERIRTFVAHRSVVFGVALSPDGRTLATGGNEREIKLWDTETFQSVGLLKGHNSQVWDLKFCRDGGYLASASMDRSVRLWDWNSEMRLAQSATRGDEPAAQPAIGPTEAPRGGAGGYRTPRSHSVTPGGSIQATIDAASPGDRIDMAPGTYKIAEMIVVNKPLTIEGTAAKNDGESLPTILKGAEGLPYVIHIETTAGDATEIRNLQIESYTSGIEHESGDLKLTKCVVMISSALEFQKVVSLKATGRENNPTDTVTLDGCTLAAKYVGTTAGRTVPDVDLILAEGGTRYVEITVTGCRLTNEARNAISNGLETRGMTAHLTIRNNTIHCHGMGVVIPNHIGAMDICDNAIWSGYIGIMTGNRSLDRSNITGNHITINNRELQVQPEFASELIAINPSACIRIGGTSAGVATFFGQEFIGQGDNFGVEDNVLIGNPKHGISLVDSPEPESYGPPTPNKSHGNIIARNDFSKLRAQHDIALGSATFNNRIFDNIGLKSLFREAGDNDRNSLAPMGEPHYVYDEITSLSLVENILGDPATRSMWVWLPPNYETSPAKRYPTIYLLHGFTGDHTSFKFHPLVNVDVGAVAAELIDQGRMEEAIVIMPDASNVYGGSFYASNPVIGNYRDYIARDLVTYIDGKYRTIPDRDHRSVAGNSMGANGALSLAMAYPEVFGAVAAMSPSADYSVSPTELDTFIEQNPSTLETPTLVHDTDELIALLSGNVSVNLLYAQAAAYSPNPDNPPYYVDLPLQYPEKTIVPDVWQRWLEQDMVSQIERDGQALKNTNIFIDIGTGPVTIMPERHDIQYLRAALEKQGLTYTFVESPGDHLSYLRERTAEVLAYLSSPETYETSRDAISVGKEE